MFTYSGWNAAAYVAEEIRDPGRNVPRALALGTGAVVADLPADERALSVRDSGARACGRQRQRARRDRGSPARSAAGNIMGVVSIVSLAASISAMTLAGPRVYYAMARDGLFFRAYRRRSSALPHTVGGHHCAGGVELACSC